MFFANWWYGCVQQEKAEREAAKLRASRRRNAAAETVTKLPKPVMKKWSETSMTIVIARSKEAVRRPRLPVLLTGSVSSCCPLCGYRCC